MRIQFQVLVLGVFLVVAIFACSTKQSADIQEATDIGAELNSIVRDNFNSLGVPGMMASVWVPGEFVWTKEIGVSDRDTNAPMSLNQHVRIGSITKTFTVTMMLILADDGLLSLDDPVSKYFEGVPRGDNITLRNLANMTSGIANYTFDPGFQEKLFANPGAEWKPEELVAIGIENTKAGCPHAQGACFNPGDGWFYSNTNTVMLGLVIEKVTAKKYGQVFEAEILVPLAFKNTSHPTTNEMPEPYAHGYTLQGLPDGVTKRQDSTMWMPSWAWAVGDIISNHDDLSNWGRALGKGVLLSPEMQAERLKKVTLPPNTQDRAYALGIGYKSGWWGHGGELPGYNSVVYYRPDIDSVIVVISNSDLVKKDGGEIHPSYIVADTIAELLNKTYPLPE